MEIKVPIFESIDREKKTTKGITLTALAVSRNRQK